MLVIHKPYKAGVKAILLFGKGLIGSAINLQLDNYKYTDRIEIKFGWESETDIKSQIEKIFKKLNSLKKLRSLTIIWSAGKAGFNVEKVHAEAELSFYSLSMRLLSEFCHKNDIQKKTTFILFSSAGGLHESQTNVYNLENINIKRPYSKLKKDQEDILLGYKNKFFKSIILRVSTVYPISNFSGRLGLIAVLFLNSNKNVVSQFYGSENTLRDYISDEDIGKFVVKVIESEIINLPEINYLISGKSTSIFEIKSLVEKIINRKMLVQYKYETTNSANISFNSSLKPNGLEISNLYTNLCRIHQNMFG